MNVVITQPVAFPRVHLLNRLKWCDRYVLMNHAQFNRKVGMSQLALQVEGGEQIIGIPVEKSGQRETCHSKKIAYEDSWWRGVERKLSKWYEGRPDIDSKIGTLRRMLSESGTVAGLGLMSLQFIASELRIEKEKVLCDSESWKIPNDPSGWLLNICKQLNASEYMCGEAGSTQYLDFQRFENEGIGVTIQKWQPPTDGNVSWVHYWLADKIDELNVCV